MSSKIEQIITEIEEYIDNCKFQPLSTSKIVVNKDDIDELLAELRLIIFSTRVQQLITAINLAYEKPYLLNNIKDLYIEVAKIYNLSPKTIKWSIRTSIDTLNRSVSIDTLCSVFSLKFRPETVTPKYFITLIVEYFKQE